MDNSLFSPLAALFPWLSPVVVNFAVVDGGVEVELYRNNQLLKDWHTAGLRRLLPEPFIEWVDDHQLAMGTQPYPLVKQLWRSLMPFASEKFLIDASDLAELEEVSQPRNFTLVWTLNRSLMRIEGHYEGADRYLGMGWFQNGKKVWALSTDTSTIIDAKIKNLIVPIQQGKDLLDAIIPALRVHLSNRVDFQYITDFTPQAIVLDVNHMRLVLGLQSNYSSLLPISLIHQQQADILLADQAIIQFPYQALTPAIIDLLSSGSSIEIFGTDIPVFINEQLPIWQKYGLISADMVATITQSHPIVSVAMLKPTISFTHIYEQGIGKYAASATYQYQHHVLDMMALLVAHQQHQRFVQQHGIWFEWPNNSESLFAAIQRQLVTRFLRPEEVMGLDDRYAALVDKPPTAHTIQLHGTGLVERGQEVLEQLKYHGIPGCIVGEAGSVVPMFITFCENLVRDNQQVRILWLVPSTKKGSVTRAIDASTLGNYSTVAPQEALQPALMSRLWTVVIFYEIEQLLNRRLVTQALSQLRWNWAFASATSQYQLSPETMPLLHIPEQYYKNFCLQYIFDVQKSIPSATTSKDTSTLQPAQPVLRTESQPASDLAARKIMVARILPLEEVMGLDDRYAALVNKPLTAHTIQLHGATIIERGQEVLEQLKHHGIPGCIVGEAGAVVPMFITFCENLVRDNQQVRILWLVPSTKKGSVTRVIDASTLGNYSTVAPQETLQPALMSRLWTVVIFYEIEQLLNRRLVTQALSQLSWNWAFASATSRYQLTPAVMPLLHISENYYERFCAEYIFDVQKSIPSITTSKDTSTLQPAQPVLRTESQPATESEAGKVQISVPPPLMPSPAPQPTTPTIQQNAKKIQSDVPSALIPSRNITFWEQARQLKDISHDVVPFVPCQRSYPIYTDMDKKELQWYFYWRTEIRHDRYPPTDISYIVMHVYEALECIGFTTPELACVRLRALWIQYRDSFPQLDASLIPWIADFCVVHKLAFTAMHWYASLLSVPHCTVDERFIAEAWFRLGGNWERMPSAVLYSLAGLADPLPLNQDSQSNQLVEGIGGVAVASVENFLRSQQHVPNLLTLYGGGGMYTVKRFPFWGAVTERSYDPITVAEVNGAFNSVEFRRALGGILKYAAYLERKSRQNTTESFAPTIEVSWQEAIEAALVQKSLISSSAAMGQSKRDEKIVNNTGAKPKWPSARRTIDPDQAYEQLQGRLRVVDEEQPQAIPLALSQTPVVQSRPAAKREAEDLTISQRAHAHTQLPPEPQTRPEPMQKEQGEIPHIAVLKRYWHVFDDIHARQTSGMKPLWGLVEDLRRFNFEQRFHVRGSYQCQLYQQLLPSPILAEIDQLWGTTMHHHWPGRIISEPFPHFVMAEAFGPALKFWHGCALTAWFFCEGPSSRTDLAGLAAYFQKEVQALEEMGMPINEQLFKKLIQAEAQLGRRQSILKEDQGDMDAATAFTASYRREGFETLRDIISFYRRQWAKQYLDQYLYERREMDLSAATLSYELYVGTQETPPTTQKFAKAAAEAVNHWFGGNISELCKAIQKDVPFQSQHSAILPADKLLFASAVFAILSQLKSSSLESDSSLTKKAAEDMFYRLNKLVVLSFWYVQLEEALGYRATLTSFGTAKFSEGGKVLHTDINKAWILFSKAIEDAKKSVSHEIRKPLLAESYSVKLPSVITREPSKTVPEGIQPLSKSVQETMQATSNSTSVMPSPIPTVSPAIHLDLEAISALREDSERLRGRLLIGAEAEAAQEIELPIVMSDPAPATLEMTVPTFIVDAKITSMPEVDEDWQIILQQWQPEHWEIIRLLYEKQYEQLATIERKVHRPASLLIDELNLPVDEQLGDLLVDPDTRTISEHLHAIVGTLIHWYLSSEGR